MRKIHASLAFGAGLGRFLYPQLNWYTSIFDRKDITLKRRMGMHRMIWLHA